MQDGALDQLLLTQMQDVQHERPDLELVFLQDGDYAVRGPVRFEHSHNGNTVRGEYEIQIDVPSDYPDTPPKVRETRGEIPRSFHTFLETGYLCLGVRIEVRRAFAEHQTLLGFVDRQVVPFLISYSYFTEFKEMLFGEYDHGIDGILDYYNEFFGTTDDLVSLRLLEVLAGGTHSQSMICPCRSGLHLVACHGPRLEELRPHQTASEFYSDLIDAFKLFQEGKRHSGAGQGQYRKAEGQVTPFASFCLDPEELLRGFRVRMEPRAT